MIPETNRLCDLNQEEKLKKWVNFLSVLSLVMLLPDLVCIIIVDACNAKLTYVAYVVLCISIVFSAPLMGRATSLLFKRKIMKPKKWLLLDSILMVVVFSFFCFAGFGKMLLDVPAFVTSQVQTATGLLEEINQGSPRKFAINNTEVQIDYHKFSAIDDSDQYTVVYLPNSKYVLDIVDDTGRSLADK